MKRYPQCILASCSIPWDEEGKFMEELFRRELRALLKETAHLYIFGTAGEGYAVSESQFDHIVGVFAEETEEAHPMVGLISLSTAQIKERIRRCRDMGIHDFQISLPSWGPLKDWELFRFFEEICGSFGDCRFLHYNLARTKRILGAEDYAELESRHPNLAAAKITSDSIGYIGRLMTGSSELQYFFTDLSLPYAAGLGECGLLISMASINWKTARKYFESATKGDYPKAMEYQKQLLAINIELRRLVLPESHMDGAFDKMYTKLRQRDFPLRLAPPYRGSGDETFQQLCSFLQRKFPMWYPQD